MAQLPTVSGLSAGAYMAVQHQVAFSASVGGAGVIAGGPYGCADSSVVTALSACMDDPALIDVEYLVKRANDKQARGEIDPLSNLARTAAWIFSGTKDTTVRPGVAHKLVKSYLGLGMNESSVTTVFDIEAAHAMPTTDYGNACSHLGPPYINKCKFDAAGVLLATLLNVSLSPPRAPTDANIVQFAQEQYTVPAGRHAAGLAEYGFAYVPTGCEFTRNALQSGGRTAAPQRFSRPQSECGRAHAKRSCRVHLAYHGCHQSAEVLNMTFVRHAGYNGWAESNGVVVIYPQIEAKTVVNPKGCYDWWGYTNEDYDTKKGLQLSATHKMIEAVLSSIASNATEACEDA